MEKHLLTIGRLAGAVGILLCVVAAVGRLLGNYRLLGFESATLLQGGIAAVVVGCFLLLLARSGGR